MSATSRSRAASESQGHSAHVIATYDRMLRGTGMTRRYLTQPGGGRINVLEAGQGPPVVFLHGMNTSSLGWMPLVQRLEGVRMIAVDRPGRGLSDPWPPTPPARVRSAAVSFVEHLLTELRLPRTVLVGQSGGGIWALWYTLVHPERVSGLVLLGSTPLLPGTRAPAPLRIASTPIVGDLLSRLVKPTPRTLVRLLSCVGEGATILRYPDLLEALVVGATDPVAVAADRAELRSVINPFGFRRSMRFRADQLRLIDVPTLVIWGDHDPVGSIANAQSVTRLIPDAQLEVLPVGHVPQLGCPDRSAELVATFAHQVSNT